ncbi:hypothetical protein [Pseudomonas sp.]|uniref:hypothetical protein n=1 Tax=Pseudomonas sp. TaxID=306 RepID=UPI003D0FC1B6
MMRKIGLGALFLYLPLLSNFSQASNFGVSLAELNVIKTLHADLTGDGQDEAILVVRKKSAKDEQPTLLIINNDKILVEAPQALRPVKNDYSPASFDGFEVSVIASYSGTTSVIDVQGETTEIIYPSTTRKQLMLRTVEEGNSGYNFNLQFAYDSATNSILLQDIFLNTNNAFCEQSLKSVHAVQESALLGNSLQFFDGYNAFQELKDLHQKLMTGNAQSIKLMPQDISISFDRALAAYNAKDKKRFEQTMATFLEGGGSNEICVADSYIADKYYFPSAPRWSNDLGFLFEQAGYFSEAIILLNEVITKQPKRAVAYLNLADSYWAVDNTDQALIMYEKYLALMSNQGKISKVPKRVIERINTQQNL